MKQIASVLLACVLTMCLISCSTPENTDPSKEETKPMETISEFAGLAAEPLTWDTINAFPVASESMTEAERRQLCHDFFKLQLSFPWVPNETVTIQQTKKTTRDFPAGTVFGGLPYVASTFTSLYYAMEYYDEKTGVMDTARMRAAAGALLGNQCSAGSFWGWGRVSNTLHYPGTREMTHKNGCLILGPYTYDKNMDSFAEKDTRRICDENGEQVMYESYALVKMADGLIQFENNAGHVRMIVKEANVVRSADNTIDGEKSTLVFQDQQTVFTEKQQTNGTAIRIQGGLEKEMTFAKLFAGGYIPFQIAELIGEAPIEKATASLDCTGDSITVSALSKAEITANYAIATVTATVTAPDGSQLFRYTVKADGICKYDFSLASVILPSTFNQYAAGDNTVTVKCRVSTGEEFAVYTGTLITT